MADYDLLGSFSTGGASALNGELLTKLKDAEKTSVLFSIDDQLEQITGLDAETGDALDDLGESETLLYIKAQALDLLSNVNSFDLANSDPTAFDQVAASTTGTAAVFDAVDVKGLEPGTTNIEVTQLAQRDVYQSITMTESEKDAGIRILSDDADGDGNPAETYSDADLELILSSKISITTYDEDGNTKVESLKIEDTGSVASATSFKVNGEIFDTNGTTETYEDLRAEIDAHEDYTASFTDDGRLLISHIDGDTAIDITEESGTSFGFEFAKLTTFEYDAVLDTNVTDVADVSFKTYEELADEINENDALIASLEQVGTDEFRLVIKSKESGLDNALTVSQTNIDLGFGEMKSDIIDDLDVRLGVGRLTINGEEVIDDTLDVSYDELVIRIGEYIDDNGNKLFTAELDDDNRIQITSLDGSLVTIEDDGAAITDLNFSNSSQTQTAQNLMANVDGIEYDVASNTMTIQGNLTMTAVEEGKATIDIQRDNSAILTSVQSLLESYNTLVDLVNEEVNSADSVMHDSSSFRMILSSIKEKLFDSYGENNDLNIFSFGIDLDREGHMSVDSTTFAEALTGNYDNLKDLFMGNTTDEDIASSDSTKFIGLGNILKEYIDDLDGIDGLITSYEESMASRQEALEKEREEALESLDLKYSTLAKQFSDYGAIITQMESAFSGMKMMIEQSVASDS